MLASGQITSNFHFRETNTEMSIMVKMVITVEMVIWSRCTGVKPQI